MDTATALVIIILAILVLLGWRDWLETRRRIGQHMIDTFKKDEQ